MLPCPLPHLQVAETHVLEPARAVVPSNVSAAPAAPPVVKVPAR